MKFIISAVAVSCVVGALSYSAHAQARGGGGGGASVGSGAGVGTSGGIGSARASAGVGSSAASGVSGNLATGSQTPGTALATPAGGTITQQGTLGNVAPGSITTTPVGPLNPGGISGIPLQTVGRTFDRSIIGGAPINTAVDPANPQPFRFPPASETLQPFSTQNDLVNPNTGIPNPAAFAPVTVGNTVGTNFGRTLTTRTPEPVAVNLPPGARVVTNISGVPEIVVPAPGVVTAAGSFATNGVVPPAQIIPSQNVGRGPTFESANARAVEPGQRIAPPRRTTAPAARLD